MNVQDNRGTLRFSIDGLKHARGSVRVYLFKPHDNVMRMKEASRTLSFQPSEAGAGASFEGLEFGHYALSAFHDENDNGALDHKFGVPAEPIGFSNGFRLGLLSGPPTFEKLRIPFDKDGQTISITLQGVFR